MAKSRGRGLRCGRGQLQLSLSEDRPEFFKVFLPSTSSYQMVLSLFFYGVSMCSYCILLLNISLKLFVIIDLLLLFHHRIRISISISIVLYKTIA